MSVCAQCSEAVCSNDSFVLKCDHVFCYKCLCEYIKNNINCKIKCPSNNCQKFITDRIIRQCLSNSHVAVYEQLSILQSTKKAKKCLTSECPVIMIIDNENSIFHCYYCGQPNCLKCNKRHYPNQCGRINLNENAVENAAAESIKLRRREALENQFKNQSLISNPDAFECSICFYYILPRQGLIIRNCHHCFCKNCFQNTLNNIEFINEFKCPQCHVYVNDLEIIKIIGMQNLVKLNCKVVGPKFFCCKHPDCYGLWDSNNCKGSYNCPICNHKNCLECEDIHEGMTCESFRKLDKYKDAQNAKKKFQEGPGVRCICGQILIQHGGCGALRCDRCNRHVCVFTGKEAGNRGPNSCLCTTAKPCHPKCIYGCIPE